MVFYFYQVSQVNPLTLVINTRSTKLWDMHKCRGQGSNGWFPSFSLRLGEFVVWDFGVGWRSSLVLSQRTYAALCVASESDASQLQANQHPCEGLLQFRMPTSLSCVWALVSWKDC
jgi:hypothetical protein